MVWIHGGAFEAGGTVDPMFDCHNFVKENPDVIVVTIAYRLGVFGFLHLSHLPDGKDYQDSQNIGLLDQIMALKWVHENIAGFGGDPSNVTIFGAFECPVVVIVHRGLADDLALQQDGELSAEPERCVPKLKAQGMQERRIVHAHSFLPHSFPGSAGRHSR